MARKKLTDRQISALYRGFMRDYDACKNSGMSSDAIKERLYLNLFDSIRERDSLLYQFKHDEEEKEKIYEVLYAFLDARPESGAAQSRVFFQQQRPVYHVSHTSHVHYCHHNDMLYNYLLWDYSFRRRPTGYYGYHHHHHHYHHHHYDDRRYHSSSDHRHSSRSSSGGDSKNDDDALARLVAFLLFVALAIAAGIALFAVVHTLSEIANHLERFYYNEGILQAALSLANMAASFALSGTLVSLLLTAPLVAAFTFAAVSNPVGWAATGVVLISLIAGALTCNVSNKVLNYSIKRLNEDSLDPEDPYRFTLTPYEARQLEEQGIDPVRVKCAIIELRATMDESRDVSELSIFATRSEETKSTLDLVRRLRSGRLSEVDINGVTFDCRKPVVVAEASWSETIPTGWVVEENAVKDSEVMPPWNAVPAVPSAPPLVK